jgi:arginine decarboxylase
MRIANRIPKDFFVAKGSGESDIAIHAGSFHLALKEAGIEKYNIMSYSSVLPSIATEVRKPKDLTYGAVMDTIIATSNAQKGERATAGIIFGWLFNRKTGERHGGLVCEQNGKMTVSDLTENLHASLNELYTNGFDGDFELRDIKMLTESFTVRKKFGTALCALCFVNHVYPVIDAD